MPSRYRKRPVVIDAVQYTGDTDALDRWLDQWHGEADGPHMWADGDAVVIGTLEGDMTASVGDWIIRGVQGEFYPCKSDIFKATYEAVADDPVSEVPDGEAS